MDFINWCLLFSVICIVVIITVRLCFYANFIKSKTLKQKAQNSDNGNMEVIPFVAIFRVKDGYISATYYTIEAWEKEVDQSFSDIYWSVLLNDSGVFVKRYYGKLEE